MRNSANSNNLKSVDVKLTDAEIAELDEKTAPVETYPNWFNSRTVDQNTKKRWDKAGLGVEPSSKPSGHCPDGFAARGSPAPSTGH